MSSRWRRVGCNYYEISGLWVSEWTRVRVLARGHARGNWRGSDLCLNARAASGCSSPVYRVSLSICVGSPGLDTVRWWLHARTSRFSATPHGFSRYPFTDLFTLARHPVEPTEEWIISFLEKRNSNFKQSTRNKVAVWDFRTEIAKAFPLPARFGSTRFCHTVWNPSSDGNVDSKTIFVSTCFRRHSRDLLSSGFTDSKICWLLRVRIGFNFTRENATRRIVENEINLAARTKV